MLKGSCLCGAVTYQISGAISPIEGCHCRQCRKWTGHFLASIEVPRDGLTVHGSEHVRWYHSSDKARRGFCGHCGSSLFFDPLDQHKHHWIGVAMGSLDTGIGAGFALHIFTEEKGGYYEIPADEQSGAR